MSIEQIGVPRSVSWAPEPNTLTCHVGGPVPSPVTSAVAMVFNPAGRLLVVHVRSRGWDLPGGHVEDGESVPDAVVREVLEEAGVQLAGPGNLVGFQHLHLGGAQEAGYAYPWPDAYMPVFLTRLDREPALGSLMPEEVDGVEFRNPFRAAAEFTRAGRTWAPLLEHVVATGLHLGD